MHTREIRYERPPFKGVVHEKPKPERYALGTGSLLFSQKHFEQDRLHLVRKGMLPFIKPKGRTEEKEADRKPAPTEDEIERREKEAVAKRLQKHARKHLQEVADGTKPGATVRAERVRSERVTSGRAIEKATSEAGATEKAATPREAAVAEASSKPPETPGSENTGAAQAKSPGEKSSVKKKPKDEGKEGSEDEEGYDDEDYEDDEYGDDDYDDEDGE